MLILKTPLPLQEIQENHNHFYQTMVKIVVDLEEKILALDAEMHADLEQNLLEQGSLQNNLWGANIYFDKPGFIEFNSLINIRPGQGNMSMDVQDENLKAKMQALINELILF